MTHFPHRHLAPSCRPTNIVMLPKYLSSLCNKIVFTNLHGGTMPQKFKKVFEIPKLFWAPFQGLWAIAPFKILSSGMVTTTKIFPDVSTSFPTSFFTVIYSFFNFSLKSRIDYTARVTTNQYYISVAFLTSTCYKPYSLCSLQLDKTNIHHNSSMLHLMEAVIEKTKSPLFAPPVHRMLIIPSHIA